MTVRRALPLLLVLGAVTVASASASAPPPTDRSIKLDLIEKLKHGPQILILGDSRGRQAEPSYLKRLTGMTGFNAAVMGGNGPDAWVFIRYTADRFPGQKRRYIWFVSSALTGNIPDPRTEADPRGRRYLQELAAYLNDQPLNVEWPKHPFDHYRADGGLATKAWPPTAAHVAKIKADAAAQASQIRQKPPGAPSFSGKRYQLFEHLLGYLNARGERPVIVLNPLYPTVYASLEQYDKPYLAGALDYLQTLRPQYDFVVVNCENIHACGGNDTDWANVSHVDRFNMQRMLRHILRHSEGALK
jgi:hypothetical protein